MPAISCRNLVKTYDGRPPVEAVRGIDLEVREGECFGLLGPNGAGKTTTIEIIEGLLPATSGDVEVLGRVWGRDDDDIRQRIGISLQETRLSEKLSSLETVTLFRSFYRQGIAPEDALRRLDLQEKSGAWVGKLSGGQRQRLAVACALMGDPELLFLDEPTTGLDPQSRRQLWDIIRGFREQRRTVLLTTHYMEEAERLCDRVGIVDQGKMIALGTPRELIASLGGEHVIEFSVDASSSAGWHAQSEAMGVVSSDCSHALPVGQGVPPDGFTNLPAVSSAWTEDGRIALSVTEPHVALPALLSRLQVLRCDLTSLTTRHASLEDVFVKLAGRHLDGEERPHA
jgi:ABC-2 type transport system ATP-binding protein